MNTLAPSFSLPDQQGVTHSLSDYRGKWLVLYFYPKDDTAGCTTEACSFRDLQKELSELNAVVLGVSKDTSSSHQKFAKKFKLNFPLLSDTSTETIQAYAAWGPKKFLGKEYMGIIRSTVLINPLGEIAKKYPEVDPVVHAGEILADLIALQKNSK